MEGRLLHSAAYFSRVIVSTQRAPIPLPFLLHPSLPTAHSMETLLQLEQRNPLFSLSDLTSSKPPITPPVLTLTSLCYLFFSKKGSSCLGNSSCLTVCLSVSLSLALNLPVNCLSLIDYAYTFKPTSIILSELNDLGAGILC